MLYGKGDNRRGNPFSVLADTSFRTYGPLTLMRTDSCTVAFSALLQMQVVLHYNRKKNGKEQ